MATMRGPGNARVLATPETLAIMRRAIGDEAGGSLQPLAYGETLTHRRRDVRLVPAGHVLGSAQIVLEYRGARVVVSGDYKRRPRPDLRAVRAACPAIVFITEATFGLPVFRHPPDAHEIDKLLHSLRALSRALPSRRRLCARQMPARAGAAARGRATTSRSICMARCSRSDRAL